MELRTLCGQMAETNDRPTKVDWLNGESIFPNELVKDGINVNMTTEEMTAAAVGTHKDFFPIFNACILYKSPVDARTHQTGHSFMLVHLETCHSWRGA